MDRKKMICALLGICASLFLTSAVVGRTTVKAEAQKKHAQENLAREVFRFHVLANSDSEEDQKLKLKVRDEILDFMKMKMPKDNASAEAASAWARKHLKEIEEVAAHAIRREGYSYDIHAEVCETYFPDRVYGEILFPKGYYQALRIQIGEAAGHNWWCVLYPNLCFTDAVCAKVDKSGQEKLQNVLSEEDFEAVTVNSDFQIKSFFLEHFWGKDEE